MEFLYIALLDIRAFLDIVADPSKAKNLHKAYVLRELNTHCNNRVSKKTGDTPRPELIPYPSHDALLHAP